MKIREALGLALVAAQFVLTAGARVAFAQNVIVTSAAPGSTVELMLNDDRVATATVDAAGFARLGVSPASAVQSPQADGRVVVDACGNVTRVLLVENYRQPPAIAGACNRQTVPGVFIVQSITTFLVDVSSTPPSVYIRQGPAPASWLAGAVGDREGTRTWVPGPTGLVLSASAAIATFANAAAVACGDVQQCSSPSGTGTLTVGATYWLQRFLAAEVNYIRPANVVSSGSGTNFRFASTVTTDVLTIVAKAGGQAGPVRLYGLGGADYQSSVSSTSQTVNATSTGGSTTTTAAFRTTGWSWTIGGGLERWMKRWIGIYIEGARVGLKGASVDNNGEGALDDHMNVFTIGIRVHAGR